MASRSQHLPPSTSNPHSKQQHNYHNQVYRYQTPPAAASTNKYTTPQKEKTSTLQQNRKPYPHEVSTSVTAHRQSGKVPNVPNASGNSHASGNFASLHHQKQRENVKTPSATLSVPANSNHADLEEGHHHHQNHNHAHHFHGTGTSERQSEQESEQCRVFCLQFIILGLYAIYMIVLVGPLLLPKLTYGGLVLCVLFNLAFFLMTVSFWQCATMDPGEVPLVKGPRLKHSKFCVKCHNAKPDRTHHCSTCGRCVLNMDHHCPWLANCVGFHNRQFFVLILCYGVICSTIMTVHGILYMFTTAPYVWPKSVEEVEGKTPAIIGFFSAFLMLFCSLVLLVALVTFLRFHLSLVFSNSTTIETQFNRANPDYNLGSCLMNCKQVFGSQWYLWWCPLWREPLGDGYIWGKQLLQQIDKQAAGDDGAEMTRMIRRSVDHRHR